MAQAAKPIQKQIAEGDPSKVGVRKLQEALDSIPKTSVGIGPPPKTLRGAARKAWMVWAEELGVMQLEHRPDAQALEAACIAYHMMLESKRQVDKGGITVDTFVTDDKGKKWLASSKLNPAFTALMNSMDKLRYFCSEFGFTPMSRQRMTVEVKVDDEREDKMSQRLSKARPVRPMIEADNQAH